MGLFNNKLKKDSIQKLKAVIEKYDEKTKIIQDKAVTLHHTRTFSLEIIKKMEVYVNSLANTPKEFATTIEEVNINVETFTALSEIEYDEQEMIKLAGGGAALGTAAGVATAALAPTAAMAIATTFGTASTGAAISTLSGAAATKAALAWLGGGALLAGGKGVAGGTALLGLAGPVGWGIGAASLAAGGLFANKKNKQAAIKAEKEYVEVIKQVNAIELLTEEVVHLEALTENMAKKLDKSLVEFMHASKKVTSFLDFDQEARDQLRGLLNTTQSLSVLFTTELGEENAGE